MVTRLAYIVGFTPLLLEGREKETHGSKIKRERER